jgi:hypothetical protein
MSSGLTDGHEAMTEANAASSVAVTLTVNGIRCGLALDPRSTLLAYSATST